MPLNIDWQQILLHLFNFIILAAGLSFLLFKPVKKFMAQREESYKKAAAEHARKLEETETLEKERQVKIAALDSDLTEREKQALSVTEARKKRMLEEAREEADKIVEDGRRRAAAEREKYIAGAGDEIAAMVARSAEKLLAAESNAQTDSALYDRYLSMASAEAPLTAEQQAAMANNLKKDGGSVRREEVADIIGKAAESAIMAQGSVSDSAVYDQFLSEVNKGDGNE